MMRNLNVLPVRTARERRLFLTFPWRIYRNDPLWVPPLLPERRAQLDPQRGPFFKRGEAEFSIAWQVGHPVGTICAGGELESNRHRSQKACLFGFFECYDDYAIAEALLDRVQNWASSRRLQVLLGPFNLDRENGYGLLMEGRDRPPVLLCGHTPQYYKDLVERYGFQPARPDSLAFAVGLEETPAMQRLSRLADRLRARGTIAIRAADLLHWQDEIARVHNLVNRALAHLEGHTPWRRDELEALLKPFRAIVDPELVLFAEIEGQPVGWFPGIPNLNEALQHANGLRYPWDYVKLWWHLRHQPRCLTVKSVLVVPEYWSTGVSVLLFDEMAKRARAKGFEWVDLSLTGADNPYTPALAEKMGARMYKRYRVYRLPLKG